MALGYWQAKIWGILHDPIFKGLHGNKGRGGNSFWGDLEVMKLWGNNNPENPGKKILEHIKLADYITSASDRSAIGSLIRSVNYKDGGLELRHLLSAAGLTLRVKQLDEHRGNRTDYLEGKEQELLNMIPRELREGTTESDAKKLFWWLWRCLPEAAVNLLGDENLILMPAETRIPDASLWSHLSLTSAMAGALAGYDLENEDVINRWPNKKELSRAYLASFTFSPIQELIKASRKMSDLWAGSWILHYLSAKVCWQLAQQYGPDCFIYPSLYQQPLIDCWLLNTYAEFSEWVETPEDKTLLTAGFPNVIVLVLPKDKVGAAMQTARNTLLGEWRAIAHLVFEKLGERRWMASLTENSRTWESWLNAQWQTYHVAVPIGREDESLTSSEINQRDDNDELDTKQPEDDKQAESWIGKQNEFYNLGVKKALFQKQEKDFIKKAGELNTTQGRHPSKANVGSWWNHAFDQTRFALAAVKNAREWTIPTAFGPRSTVSGIGPVVHPDSNNDWISEKLSKQYWKRQAGLFDGIEQLNATETVKRGLSEILEDLLNIDEDKVSASYPDLTAGVAGYLKNHLKEPKHRTNFDNVCREIFAAFPWAVDVIKEMRGKWGIPWADERPQQYHPRLLNAGWLVEDANTDKLENLQRQIDTERRQSTPDTHLINDLEKQMRNIRIDFRNGVNQILSRYYGDNNPADWYVLAAGDGDGMSDWLKGYNLKTYRDYIPSSLVEYATTPSGRESDSLTEQVRQSFANFIEADKRMGPSTHNALGRALLDFSNQLVPYLTEERYAGRLIYGGGDDVLAYTNLWEWDQWLWDIRQCFRGQEDPKKEKEFDNTGDYWRWRGDEPPKYLSKRPLFTMGSKATISFGIVVAHHSVPLAIALENLWEAEEEAKEHKYWSGCNLKKYQRGDKDYKEYNKKDAVQVRILYGNGNVLKATSKFDVFYQWQQLLDMEDLEASIFEGVANLWEQHPVPVKDAIAPWVNAFSSRRENLQDEQRREFQILLIRFLESLWDTTEGAKALNEAVQNWFKVAAFVNRKRKIKLREEVTA
ncbi:MAG: hypothetical protein N5P05_001736 [Chroococcopsis gigantea SAG 12.99]|nr:type III-B CRISPR-associated protein Cas10/Cmr2 [Chlorogloea purpurea SAG 13.99]MDV3000130.1 hypothetical protein [Chroococcopsis gigantea SAG 12.99]